MAAFYSSFVFHSYFLIWGSMSVSRSVLHPATVCCFIWTWVCRRCAFAMCARERTAAPFFHHFTCHHSITLNIHYYLHGLFGVLLCYPNNNQFELCIKRKPTRTNGNLRYKPSSLRVHFISTNPSIVGTLFNDKCIGDFLLSHDILFASLPLLHVKLSSDSTEMRTMKSVKSLGNR